MGKLPAASIRLKIVAVAPTPTPRITTISTSSRGLFLTCRKAYRTSSNSPFIDSSSHGDDQQRRVILQRLSSEGGDGLQHRLLKFSCGCGPILQQQLDQALFTEVLACTVGRF